MSKRSGRSSASSKTATASTHEGELKRHLAALGLPSADAYRSWCREQGFGIALHKDWQERRAERLHAERIKQKQSALKAIEGHLKSLDIADEAAYYAWCRASGFAETLNKRPRQKQDEILARQRERSAVALNAARRFDRRPEDLIRAIAAGAVDADAVKTPHLRAIVEAFASAGPDARLRDSFLSLLLHCHKLARLLSVDPAIAHLGPHAGNTYIAGMFSLARRHADWVRPLETWKPDSLSGRRQFAALARHLTAKYEVPSFMDAAWFLDDPERARRHQDWFLHIGRGQNIRTADLPVHLTKRAAHLFLQGPKDLPVEAALRWAQVLSLGGDEMLARALLATRLADLQEDEPFWQSVIFFFINNPMLDSARIGSIVDFIHHRRFVPAEVLGPAGEVVGMAAPEPNFSMKGRTGLALLRRVEEWHRDLARETKKAPLEWTSSGFGGFSWTHRDAAAKLDITWTIDEIVSSRVLQEEGKEMRHCVASYAPSCARGATSVWSMQVREGMEAHSRRVMTIEVSNSKRTVVQARGRCNKAPGEKRASPRLLLAPDILGRWAAQQGLFVPSYLFNR